MLKYIMDYSVDMTDNQFQQNISLELTDRVLNTSSTGNFLEFLVSLTVFF